MASRPARVTLGALAVLTLGAAGYAVARSEHAISQHRTALRAFDLQAREAFDALVNVRVGQQAYVAAGQGVALWTPKVAALVGSAQTGIETLRQTAEASDARGELMDAAASVAELTNIDKRARDYMHAGQPLMASDVVFTEGAESAALAAQRVESARVAEQKAFDQFEGGQRRLEAIALTSAGAMALFMVVALVFAGQAKRETGIQTEPTVLLAEEPSMPLQTTRDLALEADKHPEEESPAVPSADACRETAEPDPTLREAAALCTELGRVADIGGLKTFLAHAAEMLDASGLIVWVGSAAGADLTALIAHGYSRQTLARIPPVPRSADNAAAAAYRSGALQVVAARTPSEAGALVVPLLSPDGCVGALAAEIKGGRESADATQSLALIFAAQLAGIVPGSAGETAGSSQTLRAAAVSTRS